MSRIVITGGTGQVGTLLAHHFRNRNWDVVVLGRHHVKTPGRFIAWNAKTLGNWVAELEGADVLINLAGATVNCRYSARHRREIRDSRVDSTRILGKAMTLLTHSPHTWLQASTATIYAHRFDTANDESGPLGGTEPNAPDTWRFSIEVAKAWEAAAREAVLPHTRLVLLRSAMVMSPTPGGVFATLLRLIRLALGGTMGNGKQYVSWIHEADFVRAIDWVLEHKTIAGPINLCAPNPLPNAEFMATFRKASGHFLGFPATEGMLELGAILLRTETELVLKSRRVVPGLLLKQRFTFQYPDWPGAAKDLYERTCQ